MNARLNSAGNLPDTEERLMSSVTYGAAMSDAHCYSDVGIGPVTEALSGSRPMAEITSSIMTAANFMSRTSSGSSAYTGGDELAVYAHIFIT
jgi:hypothetical protein